MGVGGSLYIESLMMQNPLCEVGLLESESFLFLTGNNTRYLLVVTTSITLSATSLHNIITICIVILKPSNYLVWRTQMTELIQAMKVQNLIEEPQLEHILKEDGKVEVNPQLGEWQEKDAHMRS